VATERTDENAPRRMSRRDFLSYAWWGAAALLLVEGVAGSVAFLWPKLETTGFGGKVVAGTVDQFPQGTVTYVAEARCYISHVPEGLLALYRKCTHLGCVVPWVGGEERFNCPCHGGLFDSHGLVLGGPPPRPLDLFAMTIENGNVIIDTGKAMTRSGFSESQTTKV